MKKEIGLIELNMTQKWILNGVLILSISQGSPAEKLWIKRK